MEKPDPYGDWVLFPTQKGDPTSPNFADEELIAAARGAWPHVLAQAQKEFHKKNLGPDSASFAAQIWESVLRSVARTRQRKEERSLATPSLRELRALFPLRPLC